jgi:hypothetical protein
MFLSIGILSSWSREYSIAFLHGQDLLAAVSANPISNSASLAASYLFPIVALLSGIPVFSIIVRYNLIENGVSKLWANFWAVLFPWTAALCVYSGSLLNDVTTCAFACSRIQFYSFSNQSHPLMPLQLELRTQFRAVELFSSSRVLLDADSQERAAATFHSISRGPVAAAADMPFRQFHRPANFTTGLRSF